MNAIPFRFVSVLLLHVAAHMQKPVTFMMIAGPHWKSGGAATPAWKLALRPLDCVIFGYIAVRCSQTMQNRDCSVKIQANLAAIFVEICILEMCKAAPWSSKTSSLRSMLSAKPFDAACEEAVPQPELWKDFKSDHRFIVSIFEINDSKRTKRDAVSMLSHQNSLGRHPSWQRNSYFSLLLLSIARAGDKHRGVTRIELLITRSPHTRWRGSMPTLQVEQSNILWRIAVTAKQVKIKLTPFPLKLHMMVTSWILSYWGYNWFVQYFEAWGKVLLWHCDLVTRCYSVLMKKHQLSIIYWNISNVKLRPNYWLPFTFRSWKELHSILYCAIKFEEIL